MKRRGASQSRECVTNVLFQPKPVEMLAPRRLAILILAERGWLSAGELKPPRHFRSYWSAADRNQSSTFFRCPPLNPTFLQWKKLGYIEDVVGENCSTRRSFGISDKARSLFLNIAPETLAAARGFARALIWIAIKDARRMRQQVVRIPVRRRA